MGFLQATWRVLLHPGGRGTLPKIEIEGPGIDDFQHDTLRTLADALIQNLPLADLWTDYLMAETALQQRVDEDGEEVDPDWLADRRDDAWDALVPELPRVLRLGVAEAQFIAGRIDEQCGRVGTSWRAA